MTSSHAAPPRRGHRWRGIGWLFLVLVVPCLLLPAAAANGGPAPSWADGAVSWTNGTVLCDFEATVPGVTVSSPSLAGTGLSVGLNSIEEVTPTGSPVAVASMDDASWVVSNESTDDAFDLAYSSVVALVAPTSGRTVGSTAVEIQFVLPAYTDGDTGGVNQVTMELSMSNWTWQSPTDTLALVVPLAPAYPGHEALYAPATGGVTVQSRATPSGTPLEAFTAGVNATIHSPGAAPTVVPIIPAFSIQPSIGLATLVVGGGAAGGFQSLNYSAEVSVILPSTVLGLPWYDYVVVGAAAALVSLVVASGTRRLRARPSDLTYAEDEV